MKIHRLLTTQNRTNASRGVDDIDYLVIHYTSTQASAKNNAKYFASRYVGASAHYFADGAECWQSVLDEDIAWHCGAKSYVHPKCRNSNSIGIEVCSDGKFNAAEIEMLGTLVRGLMKKYDIPASRVIRHHDVTGKKCPAYYVNDERWAALKKTITTKEVAVPEAPKDPKLWMNVVFSSDAGKDKIKAVAKGLNNPWSAHSVPYAAKGDVEMWADFIQKAYNRPDVMEQVRRLLVT